MSDTAEVYCTTCGEGIRQDAEFCPACGTQQKQVPTSSSSGNSRTVQQSSGSTPQRSATEISEDQHSNHESNCQRCGTPVAAGDWFCQFCGKERPACPDCGAEMDDKKCKNCGLARQAPCGECGLMISAAAEECPNCSYKKSEEVAAKSQSRKKKSLATGGIGVLLFFLIGSVIPGPDIIGMAAGALVALPFIAWGGMLAFYYTRKESEAEHHTAAELSKGREQNKTKKWRDMKREERKAMLSAAAEGLNTVGKAAQAYGKKKEKEQKEEQLDERIEAATQAHQEAQQTKQQALQEQERAQMKQQEAQERKKQIEESKVNVPKKCPFCGAKWSAGWTSGSYTQLGPETFQCTNCDHTKDFS